MQRIQRRTKSYNVAFSFRPTNFRGGWRNVMHLTTGRNTGWGGRIPAVWTNGKKLYICGQVNGNTNYCTWSRPMTKNRWYNVRIINGKIGKYYYFRIFVNGRRIRRVRNSRPRSYNNVKVYLSDPWYPTAYGYLRNLKINLRKYHIFFTFSNFPFRYLFLR